MNGSPPLRIPDGTKVIRKWGHALKGTKGQIVGGRVCSRGIGLQEWWFEFED